MRSPQSQNVRSLHYQKSLLWFSDRSLAIFVSVLFLSESVAAISGATGVKIAQQSEAISQDRNRAAAERAYQEGLQLFKQGTAESLQQAIEKWEEALPLWRAVGDRAREAPVQIFRIDSRARKYC